MVLSHTSSAHIPRLLRSSKIKIEIPAHLGYSVRTCTCTCSVFQESAHSSHSSCQSDTVREPSMFPTCAYQMLQAQARRGASAVFNFVLCYVLSASEDWRVLAWLFQEVASLPVNL